MQVKFKKLHNGAQMPVRATAGSAGYDLKAVTVDTQNHLIVVGTGLSVEIPNGYVGKLYCRSSIANYDLSLTNCVGIIDSDYRGEIMAKFRIETAAHGGIPRLYEAGDIALQFVIERVIDIEWCEVNELSQTERGTGGYGSTNKKKYDEK